MVACGYHAEGLILARKHSFTDGDQSSGFPIAIPNLWRLEYLFTESTWKWSSICGGENSLTDPSDHQSLYLTLSMADSIPIPVCSTRNRFYLSTRIDATDVLTRSSTLDRFSYGSVTPYSKGYSSPSSPKPPSSLYALSSSVLSSFNRYTGSFIACRTSDLIISFCPHRFIPQADCLVPVVTEILCHGSPQLIKISHLSI